MPISIARTPEGLDVKPQPTPEARVHVNASIESFGGGRADRTFDVGGLERTMVGLYQEAHKNANDIAVNDADNQLTGLSTKLLYDQQDGALTTQGKNAFDVPEKVSKGWQKGVSDIASKLGNDQQREAFGHRVVARWQAIDEAVHRHVASEREQYEKQTTNDFVKNRQDDALLNYTDPMKVDQAVGEQKAIIADHGRRQGWSDDAITHEQQSAASVTYSHVILRYLDNEQDLAAKDVYDKHKNELTGAESVIVDKAMQEGSSRGASQRQFDTIMSKQGVDEAAAIKAARDIKDPRVRDLTEQRVRQEFTERKQQQTQVREQNYQNVGDFVERTGGWKAPPVSQRVGLTPTENEAIDRRREQLQKGIQPTTNWSYFYGQMGAASSTGGKEAFLHENLMAHRHELADPQFEKLTELQSSLRKGEDKASDIGGYRTSTGIVHDALQKAGINTLAKEGTPDNKLTVTFHAAVDQDIAQFTHDKGKKPNAQDIQDITDKLLIKSTLDRAHSGWLGTGIGDKKQLLFEERANSIKAIPPADLQQIKAALRSQKRVVTDSAIIDLYNRGKVKP